MKTAADSTTAGTTEPIAEKADATAEEFDVRGTLTVSGAHLSHDMYSSFVGPLIPAVQDKLGVSLVIASLMLPSVQLPSVLQPLFGYASDRVSKRWFVVPAPALGAISASSIGLAPHVALVMLLLVVTGLVSASFHAAAVPLVGEFGGPKTGRAMSVFMLGGELSRTLGPIIITTAIAWFTLEGSFVVMVFGVTASIVLYFTLDTSVSDTAARARARVELRPLLRARRRWLIALLGYAAVVNIYTAPFSFFLVKLLVDKGYSDWYGGLALSVFFAAGGLGGVVGGTLSDRFGRRPVLIVLGVLTTPLLYLYLWLENGSWLVLAVLGFAGIIAMANRPIQLALAQDVLPEARGAMSGLMLAFGLATMSLYSVGFGALGDWIGVDDAFWLVPAAGVLALPLVLLLPRRGQSLPQPGDGA